MSALRPFILNLYMTSRRGERRQGPWATSGNRLSSATTPSSCSSRWHQANTMTKRLEFARPVMTTPSLRYQPSTAAVSGEGQHVAPLDPTAEGDITLRIGALNRKTDFAISRPSVVIVLHDSGSSELWSLDVTHTRGTHVPVEEPSTASDTDICDGADHWIFAGD